jgi:hypothetical protein
LVRIEEEEKWPKVDKGKAWLEVDQGNKSSIGKGKGLAMKKYQMEKSGPKDLDLKKN